MKKSMQLLTLALAMLMVLAVFASCGQPAETTAEPAVTTAAATTTAAKTKAPETTTAAPVTTKAATTTAEVTTAAPIPGLDDPIAAASHTEHVYSLVPTFTAYAEQKEDKTIGYYAYHCRYEGCTAVKDDKVYHTLINLDFENFNGTFYNYVKSADTKNVDTYKNESTATTGNVKDGMWVTAGKSQSLFQDTSAFSTNKKFTIAMDIKTGTDLVNTEKSLLFPGFGMYNATAAARYYYTLGVAGKLTNENKDGVFGFCNFNPVHKVEGLTIKADQWYRLEYEVTMSDEKYDGIKVGDIKSDGTVATIKQTFYRGTVVVYLTEMARNADGSMVRTGERTLVATQTGFDALEEDGVSQNLDLYLVKIFSGTGTAKTVVAAMDNFAVYLPGQTK